MYHRQTPDTHANHSGYLPLHMQVRRVQWYKQYLLVRSKFCLLYASYYSPRMRICVWPHAYRCVWVKTVLFYGSGATVVETLSVGSLYIHII